MTAETIGRPRIAYLSYGTGQYDSRTFRMAQTAIEAGYDVVVYARWEPGTPIESEGDGYRIVRVPALAMLAIPGLRGRALRRIAEIRADAGRGIEPPPTAANALAGFDDRLIGRIPRRMKRVRGGVRKAIRVFKPVRRWRQRLTLFPFRPLGWKRALELTVTEPADIWHGMWAGSLPALGALRRRLGGRTIYDSRDIYMRSRGFDDMGPGWRPALAAIERRWARACDAILTVNDTYASLLAEQFGVDPPPVVRNTPPRYTVPNPRPDRIRELLRLPATTRIVLYQGGLLPERGIEQGMDAILKVPDAVFVLMGFGSRRDAMLAMASRQPYTGRVHLVDPVPPSELLDWTVSADVTLMAIQPTTLNHRYTTPNKLWETISAGVPVVASDLPGMAEVINAVGCGVLVDPTDPDAIAAGITQILDAPPEARKAMSERALAAAASTYNWEAQAGVLLDLYSSLLTVPAAPAG